MIDIDAAAMEVQLRDLRGNSARPVDVTIDVDDSQRHFSLLLKKGSGPESSLHIDLDEAGVRSLLDSRHGLADFATYVVAGARRYAIVLEERPNHRSVLPMSLRRNSMPGSRSRMSLYCACAVILKMGSGYCRRRGKIQCRQGGGMPTSTLTR